MRARRFGATDAHASRGPNTNAPSSFFRLIKAFRLRRSFQSFSVAGSGRTHLSSSPGAWTKTASSCGVDVGTRISELRPREMTFDFTQSPPQCEDWTHETALWLEGDLVG